MAKKKKVDISESEKLSLEARLEALLFVAPGTTSIKQLAESLQATPRQVEQALIHLEASYAERGLRLQRHKNELRLTAAPESGGLVERFLDLEATHRLSAAALECLAIVAYQQPITRPHIDSIRGVNSDSSMRLLLAHNLVEESGRGEGPGRPILYSTTPDFLQHFGLNTIKDLPPLNLDHLAKQEELPEPQTQSNS
jgi:segregation and condensation protein B